MIVGAIDGIFEKVGEEVGRIVGGDVGQAGLEVNASVIIFVDSSIQLSPS